METVFIAFIQATLARALDWLLFSDQCAMVETWLAGKEAFLKDNDLGDNPEAVQVCTLLVLPYEITFPYLTL